MASTVATRWASALAVALGLVLLVHVPVCRAEESLLGPPRGKWEIMPDDTGVEDEELNIALGLKIKFEHEVFQEIVDPDSPNFRNFHTLAESREVVTAGLDVCAEKLRTDAEALGLTVSPMTKYFDYFEVSGTGRQILGLFRNETLALKRFQHPNVTETIVRALFYQESDVIDLFKDDVLRECMGVVLHFIDFPLVRRPVTKRVPAEPSTRRQMATCSNYDGAEYITPQTLSDMYGVPLDPVDNMPTGTAAQTVQGVYESLQVQVSSNDLQCFNDAFSLEENSLTGDAGPYDTDSCGDSCDEPNLDVQYMSGMNQGVDIEYLAFSSIGEMLTKGVLQSDGEKLPYTVSISWGEKESLYYKSNLIQMCQEIGTLSARGVTFFASTGDFGATNSQPCGSTYNLNFPASCPYVTAVGATTGFKSTREVVCNAQPSVITTGGGFSTIFTEKTGFNLDFQSEQVANYRGKMSNSVAGYPGSGSRGIPDISAPGTNYVVKIGSKNYLMDGTSCSSPVMAAITARIMLENGGTRFGNINPVLYQAQDIFFDVVSGQNSGDGKTAQCGASGAKFRGFEATDGWDAASGLGTLGTQDGAYAAYYAALGNTTLPPTPAPAPSSAFEHQPFSYLHSVLVASTIAALTHVFL